MGLTLTFVIPLTCRSHIIAQMNPCETGTILHLQHLVISLSFIRSMFYYQDHHELISCLVYVEPLYNFSFHIVNLRPLIHLAHTQVFCGQESDTFARTLLSDYITIHLMFFSCLFNVHRDVYFQWYHFHSFNPSSWKATSIQIHARQGSFRAILFEFHGKRHFMEFYLNYKVSFPEWDIKWGSKHCTFKGKVIGIKSMISSSPRKS